jgi:hypothetical protein
MWLNSRTLIQLLQQVTVASVEENLGNTRRLDLKKCRPVIDKPSSFSHLPVSEKYYSFCPRHGQVKGKENLEKLVNIMSG